MLERILGPLPAWARRDHPMLRYELRGGGKANRRWLLLLGAGVLACLLLALGYIIATELLARPLSPNLTESINRVLYAPLLVLQILLGITALSISIGAIGEIIRRQQWDTLRVTEDGAGLTLRTRWAAVFYRVRPLLAIIVGLRLLLILGILWDLTAFQGQYLDLLISGIVPQMSIPVPIGQPSLDLGVVAGIMLLAFMLTAAVLLPLTSVGFDAAAGLFLSTVFRQRAYNALVQFGLLLLRLLMIGVLLFAGFRFLSGQSTVPDGLSFGVMFLFGALGDWGLYFLHLSSFGEVWAIVPYGIFLGLALLLFALVQAFLADRLLLWAIRRAQSLG
ncbi:MAG: hypothetical protein KJ065_04165 [Anaerolineae bacterium]|nr:hypothetical protein [Anaerolineae bacterium]